MGYSGMMFPVLRLIHSKGKSGEVPCNCPTGVAAAVD